MLHAQVLQAKQQILSHKIFEKLPEADPLLVVEGGSIARVSDDDFETTLKNEGAVYSGLQTFFAMDLIFSPTAGIPIQEERVLKVSAEHFKEPSVAFPFTFTIGVPSASWKPSNHHGSWSRISPEEFAHAAVFALQRDLNSKVSEDVLHAWAKMLRNVRFDFVVCPSVDAMYFFSAKSRERLVTGAAAVRWNGLQRLVGNSSRA